MISKATTTNVIVTRSGLNACSGLKNICLKNLSRCQGIILLRMCTPQENSLTSWRPFPPFEKQLVEALADGKEVSAHLPPFEKQLVKALADGKEVFFFKFIPSAKKQETSQALETAQEDAQAILDEDPHRAWLLFHHHRGA